MNKYILYLLLAIIPSISLANTKTIKILDKAYMDALNKQYKQAIDKTLPLLNSLQLNNIDEIVLAHQILSLSYCETGDQKKSQEHLKALYAFSSNANFREFNLSPECKKTLVHPSANSKVKN